MITFKTKDFNYSPNGGGKNRVVGECLSSDTKPTTGIANGSRLIEMDTGDRFMFDEAGSQWLNITNPGGGGGAEVWLVGDTPQTVGNATRFVLRNVDTTNHMAELINNGSNYTVFLNDEELVLIVQQAGKGAAWGNTADYSSATEIVELTNDGSDIFNGVVVYDDASTAPTSVEVSVKAK